MRWISRMSSTASLLRLGRGSRRWSGAATLGSLAAVVTADELVGEVEVRLREDHARAVEDHAEVLGGGHLGDDAVHPLEDLRGGLLLLGGEVLLVPQVRLLNLLHSRLKLRLLLAHLVGGEQGSLLVEVLDRL